MASIERTAYPRLGKRMSAEELRIRYELTEQERRFVGRNASGDRQRLTLAVLLKTRQRLGYFPSLKEVPGQIVKYLSGQLGFSVRIYLLDHTRLKPTLHRYRNAVRSFLETKPYCPEDRLRVEQVIRKAAETMSDPADLINAAVEDLVKASIELPAYSTLDRIAGNIRQQVHEEMYARMTDNLNEEQKSALDALITVPADEQVTGFTLLKKTPGPLKLKYVREWASHLERLDVILDPKPFLEDIPHTKVRLFAAEARALEIGDMRDIRQKGKRHALLLCLLHHAQCGARDGLVEMFLQRMRRTVNAARQKLTLLRDQHRALEETLLATFEKVLCEANREGQSDADFGSSVRRTLAEEGGAEALREQYEAVAAYHGNNYRPLLWTVHVNHRAVLFRLLDLLQIGSTTENDTLLDALKFVQEHRNAKREILPYEVDLSFAGQRWQAFVEKEKDGEMVLDRRALEVCVFIHLAKALSCLDFFVKGSEEYPDYRWQLLSREECLKRLPEYCEAVGLPTDGRAFADSLKQELTDLSREVDAGFPDNTELTIGNDGKPHLKRQNKTPLPEGLKAFEREVQSRMPQHHLLDILKNVRHWTGFTRHFGPPSGSDPKLTEADKQYVIGTFGYGCNLGASQTASHIGEGVNRHTMRRINAQHVTSDKLDASRNDIVSEFIRFGVTRYWGDGNAMIADGTLVELRENNLLGSRHVRYDKYGKIAYHHISNWYIALFCSFISCGVWEGVYILDAFLSDLPDGLKPDTLHADTHGQSETVFSLAFLLGIKLLPRMRNWNDVVFYRPDKDIVYKHIDELFSEVIDWKLIEAHYFDMMRVILSIQAGRVPPSMLLKRLGVNNKSNTLYRAFRELGRVQRTLFLLRYVSKPKLRRDIRAETTKIESFNDFLDWITFGGPVIKSGDPVEQAKRVKYTGLVANAIMLQNVVDLTDVINGMIAEGYMVTPELISRLSPYMRRHILRFGRYILNEDVPEPLRPMPIQIAA